MFCTLLAAIKEVPFFSFPFLIGCCLGVRESMMIVYLTVILASFQVTFISDYFD